MELLRDRSQEFAACGVQLYGVSRDSPWTHIAWSQALDLTFPLLSDWNGEAIGEFRVAQAFRGFESVAERTAFLVEPGGTVSAAWHYETNEVPDVDALLAAVRAS
jgi:peroxiredoxin